VNTFNRIVVIVLGVLVVGAAIGLITATWTIPNRSVNWLVDATQWLDDNDGDLEKALLTTVSAFAGLVALIVLLLELIPRRGPAVQVTDLASGSATLSAAAISQRIEEAVVKVPHVSEVRAEVKSRRKGVLVSLDLQVDPDANLATVTDEACQEAQEVLTERVHVQLLRPPSVRLHYRELRLHRGNEAPPRRAPVMVGGPQVATATAGFGEPRSTVAVAEAPPPPELPEHLRRTEGGDDTLPSDDGDSEEKRD
jgi:hypothetical protein